MFDQGNRLFIFNKAKIVAKALRAKWDYRYLQPGLAQALGPTAPGSDPNLGSSLPFLRINHRPCRVIYSSPERIFLWIKPIEELCSQVSAQRSSIGISRLVDIFLSII